MGEIVRLIIIEAIKSARLFNGNLPSSLAIPYSLDTKTLALIEADTSNSLCSTRNVLQKLFAFGDRPSYSDASFVRNITCSVTTRSITYFATGVHTLCTLLQDLERQAGLEDDLDHISIGCDGSVINKYPNYMERAQCILDDMHVAHQNERKKIILEKTSESAGLGAGGAVAMAAADPPVNGHANGICA